MTGLPIGRSLSINSAIGTALSIIMISQRLFSGLSEMMFSIQLSQGSIGMPFAVEMSSNVRICVSPVAFMLRIASVSEGMVRIEDGDVLILVNTAERPEEIDVERARARAEEAKEIMLQKRSMQEYYQAEATLRRAMIRLKLSNSVND